MMIKSRRQMFIVIGVFALILLLGTTTYAFFNYTRTGSANTIRVGRISFVSQNEQTITLSDLFPIDPTETGIMNDSTKVGTYSIDITGDTDYSGGIEYLVSVVDANIYSNQGQIIPISLNVTVEDLGTSDDYYFINRETTNTSIYKKIVGDTLVGNQMLLVGYITPNDPTGTPDGIDGNITIKAYLDKNEILISDTYDGTESDNMGTPNSLAQGKTVLTTGEWNALQSSGLSFKVKVEANEGIWVNGSLEEIMKTKNYSETLNRGVRDNESSTFVSSNSGIDFGVKSSDTNGKGIYMHAGTENDTYPILYYRGEVNDNNVLFANQCWKAVRTTDTGGVKLIYNGISKDLYEDIPIEYTDYTINTENSDSRWTFDSSDKTWNIVIDDNTSPMIEFSVPEGEHYSMIANGTTGISCGGSIVFLKNSFTSNAYGNGGGQPLDLIYEYDALNSNDILRVQYTGNSSSTCLITIKLKVATRGDLITETGCDYPGVEDMITTSTNTYFKYSGDNAYNSPAYVGYMWGTNIYRYNAKNSSSTFKFGNGFTYQNGNYTLTSASDEIADSRHYTCFTANETCDGTDSGKIYYVYYKSGNTYYYIVLQNGKSVEDALAEMQENTVNSNAKTIVDTWFSTNLTNEVDNTKTDYRSYLEDTVFCNDRSFGVENNNGWIANGGSISTYLYFGARERSYMASQNIVKNQPSLACVNKNDRFTVNNNVGNKALTYPTGLLTEDEIVLAGSVARTESNSFYLKNSSIWTMSPSIFNDGNASIFSLLSSGQIDTERLDETERLRPVISLKPGISVIKGTGIVTDPYVIE